jgi:hypothetical protein
MASSTPLRDDSAATATGAHPHTSSDNLSHPAAELRAEIVEYDDAPNECTIFPTDAQEWELMTRWITAAEGSYVDLEAMR